MKDGRLQVSDLMIGDWVYSTFSKLPCIVTYLKLHESGYGSVETTNVVGVKDIASLSPIPLTPEILEKNGFKLDKEDRWWWLSPKIGITFWEECDIELEFENKHSSVNIHINYLHQLQHALRLCEITLNIEL